VISDATPGARPVALIIRLRTELQCGRFTPTLIAVSLPPSMRVPSSVSKTAVTVAGKAAALVQTHGSRFLINTTAPKPGVICDVISPGVVSIKFGLLAGLGNPLRAGFYAFTVTASPRGGSWHGVLSIH
jgi:hypothetical protein